MGEKKGEVNPKLSQNRFDMFLVTYQTFSNNKFKYSSTLCQPELYLNSFRVSFNPEYKTFLRQSKMIALTNKLFSLSKIENLVTYGMTYFDWP